MNKVSLLIINMNYRVVRFIKYSLSYIKSKINIETSGKFNQSSQAINTINISSAWPIVRIKNGKIFIKQKHLQTICEANFNNTDKLRQTWLSEYIWSKVVLRILPTWNTCVLKEMYNRYLYIWPFLLERAYWLRCAVVVERYVRV